MSLELVIISYGSLPCALATFTINGIPADKDWFGKSESDRCPDDCEGYDCHNMHFEAFEDLAEVRNNMGETLVLTDGEIKEIQKQLVEKLRVGDCGWCV